MRAVMLTGPQKMEYGDYDMPHDDGHSVIIKVDTCGICGSDIHYWEIGMGMNGKRNIILGHEFCGTVYLPGSRSDLHAGDRVTALPVDPCGECYACQIAANNICIMANKRNIIGNNVHGAYAEYVRVRPDMVRKLPDAVSNKEGAFIEPAAVALHAVNLAGVRSSDTVCIIGGGPIGILCAMWAKLFGSSCVVIVEVNSFRMSFIASHITVDGVIDGYDADIRKKLKTISQGGFTVAIETSATDTGLYTAIAALKPRGRMVMAGINFYGQPVPTLSLIAKEITVLGSMGYSIDEFDDVIENLAMKKLALEALVTHSVSLEDVPVVFNNLAQKSIEAIKVVVQP